MPGKESRSASSGSLTRSNRLSASQSSSKDSLLAAGRYDKIDEIPEEL